MSVPSAKVEPQPRISARAKVRPKAQLTLPEEIRRALHINEGDEVEFAVHEDGTITVRGYVSIPTDQAWFFTPEWLAGEREAEDEIAAGRGTAHDSAEDMFTHLDTIGSADALCRRSRRFPASRRTGRISHRSSRPRSAK
jgi:antitoxin PrlF